ncbi:NADH:flavin oxidoreductase [Salinisphaera sp. USBA-960]|uniref:oxidoreductase n=1 Tax=Salinisphaera orenii TaxID=856731 RepID=UPI000DBE216D|nr:NADH:flavin oxidoreductase [Salifodinibacter halophilus]NNC26903.1 NADH:flavin oxidoreductase [Salifodinibacter halophilus]
MGDFDQLLQPLTINKLTIRNRIVSTPHGEVYAEGGVPTERYRHYHAEKAKGGIGMTMCGGSSAVSRTSPTPYWWGAVDVSDDKVIPYFQQLADAVHDQGAAIMIQITHMGRRSNYDGGDWPHLMSPSGYREQIHKGMAKTIEPEEIKRIQQEFAQAARRVKEGGLDGAEVSAAHQHLIDQFWSPRTNQRTDEYGGSLENRMRFGLEVFQAIRDEVGPDFAIGMRMTGDEFHPDGLGQEELQQIAKRYADSGLIDFLDIIGSGADTATTQANCIPNMSYPPAPFLYLASGIKAEVDIPVLHAQNIKDPNSAGRAIGEGHIDMVGMTRAHIADPHFVNKIRDGDVDRIRQCVGANYCIDRQYDGKEVLCIQNAATGRERTMPQTVSKADTKRRVAIVGAGPGGLEAARVCAERGHAVTLFEASDQLGGQVNLAARAPGRDQIGGIVRWFSLELARLGVDQRLETYADAEALHALDPDIIMLAQGGRPFLDRQSGWHWEENLVVSTHDILSGAVAPGNNVLVFDVTGEHPGSTCADYLADQGSLVELATPDMAIGELLGGTTAPVIYERLYSKDVVLTPNVSLVDAYTEGEQVIAVLANEFTGTEEERAIDQIVVENGTRPNEALYYELKPESRNQGQTDQDALFAGKPQPHWEGDSFLLYRVGDCVSPGNIHAAIYDSLRLCKDF